MNYNLFALKSKPLNWGFFLSRHTAAIRWANAGISMEVVARLLGHQNLKTTAIYYRITNKRVDDELSKID